MKKYHLSGVCGTAMGTLAIMLKNKGFEVSGSDANIYPPMSILLEKNGIKIREGYKKEHIPAGVDCVVIGNALSRGNEEVEFCLENRFLYLSSAEVLKEEFIRGTCSVVIAGTHGKTTTTSLSAHILEACGQNPGFFIGGAPGNFSYSGRAAKPKGYFVIEGDEYDTAFFDKRSKFFHYLPERLIFNNLEFDHQDIFDDLAQIKKSFRLMLRQIPKNGKIFVNGDDQNALEVVSNSFTPIIKVGFGDSNDYQIKNIRYDEDSQGMSFNLDKNGTLSAWKTTLSGEHNARNAAMCVAFSLEEKLPPHLIQAGLSSFKPPERRQELKTKNKRIVVYDDFAHHPTAIAETIKAIRFKHPNSRLICAYEPRSNTSIRNTHQEQMPDAFAHADKVFFYKLHRGQSIPKDQRLDLAKIICELEQKSVDASYCPDIVRLKEQIISSAAEGNAILIMSQSNFENLAKDLATHFDNHFASP